MELCRREMQVHLTTAKPSMNAQVERVKGLWKGTPYRVECLVEEGRVSMVKW